MLASHGRAHQDRQMLDVGTGTGRAAFILALGGAKVTAVDASEMLAIARRRAVEQLLTIRFLRGDAHASICRSQLRRGGQLRMLMHTPR